jgi:hypothetical protein
MRRILALLGDDDGLADAEIAERLGTSVAEVRQASRILYRQHKVDLVLGHLVSVPSVGEGRRAA